MASSPLSLRIPPQQIDAEKALLGSVMLRPEALYEIIDIISSRAFYVEKHRIVFEAMLELFGKNDPIDLLSLSARLKERGAIDSIGGASYLSELVGMVPSAANVRHYAQIVYKKYMMRELITAADFVTELGYDEAGGLEEALEQAEKRLFEVTQKGGSQKFIALKEALGEAFERLELLHKQKGELRGVPTGFAELDNKLAGLQKSDLIILAARPSMGKTSLALDIARQAASDHGIPVGIFSLEMSAQQLVDRMLAAASKVDAWKLRTGRLSVDAEFDQLREGLDKLSRAPIYIDDQAGNNVLNMRSVARRLKSEKGLGLLIVDYLQLMAPTSARSNDSMVQQVTEISRSLKHLARELDVPVLALSQLSRAVESRGGRPRLSDLRDSGCLAGETLITRADTGERLPLRALVGKTNIPVFALDKNGKCIPATISKVFPSGRKTIYELTTRSGRKIRASANHPFMKLAGWTRLDRLQVNDAIAIPRSLTQTASDNPLSDDEMTLVAHLIGDGCILPRQPYHYTSADPDSIAIVNIAAMRLFGITGKVVRQKNWWHLYLPSPYRLTHGKHHPITTWFENLGIKRVRSYEKRVPAALFRADQHNIAFFLHHLWATDGNISFKRLPGRKTAGAIYYGTTSEGLAHDVQDLLLRVGIMSTIRTVPHPRYRTNYHVHIQGAPMQIAFCKLVGSFGERGKIIPALLESLNAIVPNTNLDAIPEDVWPLFVLPSLRDNGYTRRSFLATMRETYGAGSLVMKTASRERLQKIASVLADRNLMNLAASDIYWDRIASIVPLGVEDVFDATVPATHNFAANDIFVHNSIEQDADVVMFIHREDKYKDNPDRPNIAEILIEKHRNGPTGKVELYFDEKKATFLSIEKSDFSDFEPARTSLEDF